MWAGGQRHAPAALPREGPGVRCTEGEGWASGPIWPGAENLATTEIQFPGPSST